MSRIAIPASIEQAPAAARPLLEAVRKQLGSAPNLFRLTAASPAALEGYLGLNGALAKGVRQLVSQLRQRELGIRRRAADGPASCKHQRSADC